MRTRGPIAAAVLGSLVLWCLWLLTLDSGDEEGVLPDIAGAVAALLGLSGLGALTPVVVTLLWKPVVGRPLGIVAGAVAAGLGLMFLLASGDLAGTRLAFSVHSFLAGLAAVVLLAVPDRAVTAGHRPPPPAIRSTRPPVQGASRITPVMVAILLVSAVMVLAATVTDSESGAVGFRHPESLRSWLLLIGGFAILALAPVLQRRSNNREG